MPPGTMLHFGNRLSGIVVPLPRRHMALGSFYGVRIAPLAGPVRNWIFIAPALDTPSSPAIEPSEYYRYEPARFTEPLNTSEADG